MTRLRGMRWLIQAVDGDVLVTFASGGVSTSAIRSEQVPFLSSWWDR